MSINTNFPHWKKWAAGYACVSIDKSLKDARIRYIANQKIHHRSKTFVEEYQAFMAEYGFDSEYGMLGDSED